MITSILTAALILIGLMIGLGSHQFRSLDLSLTSSLGKNGSSQKVLKTTLIFWAINLLVYAAVAAFLYWLGQSSAASTQNLSYLAVNLGLFGAILNLGYFRLQKSRDGQTWLTRLVSKNRSQAGLFFGDLKLAVLTAAQSLIANLGIIFPLWWLLNYLGRSNYALSDLVLYEFLFALSLAPILVSSLFFYGLNFAGIERIRKRFSYKWDFLNAATSILAAWLVLAAVLGIF